MSTFKVLLLMLATCGAKIPKSETGYDYEKVVHHYYTDHIHHYETVKVPYPVRVEKEVPVPVKVLVKQPFPVYLPKPYKIEIEKEVAVPVKVLVDRPVPVLVEKHVPVAVQVPIEKPLPVAVKEYVQLPVKVLVYTPIEGKDQPTRGTGSELAYRGKSSKHNFGSNNRVNCNPNFIDIQSLPDFRGIYNSIGNSIFEHDVDWK